MDPCLAFAEEKNGEGQPGEVVEFFFFFFSVFMEAALFIFLLVLMEAAFCFGVFFSWWGRCCFLGFWEGSGWFSFGICVVGFLTGIL